MAGDGNATPDEGGEDDEDMSGPIAIAVDVSDSPADAATTSDNPAL